MIPFSFCFTHDFS